MWVALKRAGCCWVKVGLRAGDLASLLGVTATMQAMIHCGLPPEIQHRHCCLQGIWIGLQKSHRTVWLSCYQHQDDRVPTTWTVCRRTSGML